MTAATRMWKLAVFSALIGCCWHEVRGYPDAIFNGASRMRACGSLSPNHGVLPQTTQSPYVLEISSPNWIPNNRLMLTLKGKDRTTFRGFMIEARDQNSQMVGRFVASEGTKTNCEGNRALSHVSNKDKHFVRFSWTAPSISTPVHFLYTVVKEKSIFWVNQTSDYVPNYYDYRAKPLTSTPSHTDDHIEDDQDPEDQHSGSTQVGAGCLPFVLLLVRLF